MPATKKRPPFEMKPELVEERESEGVREGEDDMPMGKPSRKRSAKGAKQTKAPMDGGMYGKKPMDGEGCGCGKRKSKCDGSCGKQMDAADSPWASGVAFDMANLRVDLKCGKGAISEGEKCTKGPATRVPPKAKSSGGGVRSALEGGAMAAGAIGKFAGAVVAARAATRGNVRQLGRGLAAVGGGQALEGAGQYARGARTGSSYLKSAGAQKAVAGLTTAAINSYFTGDLSKNTFRNLGSTGQNLGRRGRRSLQNMMGRTSAAKGNVFQRKQRKEVWRGFQRSLLDD
jgi:hypothetical protein